MRVSKPLAVIMYNTHQTIDRINVMFSCHA
jgi:hypothetical protein